MIKMRAHLLLLLLAVAAAPLKSTALSPEELAPEKKIPGVNPGTYAAEQQKPAPATDVKKEAPKVVAGTTSDDMVGAAGGLNYAGGEKKPEGKSDNAVKKPMENPGAKVIPGVKATEKSNVYENAVASEKKAIDATKKSKIKGEEAKDKAEEKKFKIKSESFGYDKTEKKPKNKSDDIEDAEAKKKPKNKSDDIEEAETKKKPKNKSVDFEDAEAKKKSKNKSDDIEDAEAKKKPEKKSDSYEDAGAKKKEKKAKSKENDSSEDTKKKSESKSEAYKDGSTKKKSKKKKSGSSSEDDFDAVPMETPADESTPAADSYQAPTTETMAATDSPDGYAAPTTQTMAATDSPDGYVLASDSPDGYAAPATQTMAASDSPDGYVPATDWPDGEVPASDSPDGYDASTEKKKNNKVDVQSFDDAALPVPEPVLKMLSPLIKAQCAKTEYPSVCETSIAKLPFIPPVLDSVGVLKLAMDAVRARIQEAKNEALEVAKEPGTSKLAQGAISDCLQLYDDISYSYDNALAALKRGDKASAVAAVDGARTDVDTCDNGFRQSSRGKPPLAGLEKLLAKLSSNVLCMNRNLKRSASPPVLLPSRCSDARQAADGWSYERAGASRGHWRGEAGPAAEVVGGGGGKSARELFPVRPRFSPINPSPAHSIKPLWTALPAIIADGLPTSTAAAAAALISRSPSTLPSSSPPPGKLVRGPLAASSWKKLCSTRCLICTLFRKACAIGIPKLRDRIRSKYISCYLKEVQGHFSKQHAKVWLDLRAAELYSEADICKEGLTGSRDKSLHALFIVLNSCLRQLEEEQTLLFTHNVNPSELRFTRLPEVVGTESPQWTEILPTDGIRLIYQNLQKLDNLISSQLSSHKKPSYMTINWLPYICGAIGLSACSLWLLRHSSLMGSLDLDSWIGHAKEKPAKHFMAVSTSFFTNILWEIISVGGKPFESFKGTDRPLMDKQEVRQTEKSLQRY